METLGSGPPHEAQARILVAWQPHWRARGSCLRRARPCHDLHHPAAALRLRRPSCVRAPTVITTAATVLAAPTPTAQAPLPLSKLKVDELKGRLSALGLTTTGKKAELVGRLEVAESGGEVQEVGLAAVRQAAAAASAGPAPYASSRPPADAELLLGLVGGAPTDLIQPEFVLPGAYQMPEKQLAKRQRTAGAPKWTTKAQKKALHDISNGREPTELVADPRYQPRKASTAIDVNAEEYMDAEE